MLQLQPEIALNLNNQPFKLKIKNGDETNIVFKM